MFTSISPNPRFARCALSAASASAAVMSGTSRRSSFATALCGKIVFPPGPVYPPTRPSMLTVGPVLAARGQLAFDHALGAERDGHLSVESLGGGGHEDADGTLERREHLRLPYDLGEVRRADLLLALGDEHEVHRGLAAGPAD